MDTSFDEQSAKTVLTKDAPPSAQLTLAFLPTSLSLSLANLHNTSVCVISTPSPSPANFYLLGILLPLGSGPTKPQVPDDALLSVRIGIP